jgi:hypothetical protein
MKYDGIMKKAFFLMIVCVFIITIASIPDVLCYPPAGSDYMPSTTATIELEIIGMFTETVTVNGPTSVGRSSPYDPGDGRIKIDTEIAPMSLTGTSSHIGPITIIESPSKVSNGAIQQLSPGVDFPANSFFDVFVEIQTMVGTFHNDDPVLMQTTINSIPPWGSTYISPPSPIPLKDEHDNIIGFIRHVSHEIPPPPPVGGYSFQMEGYIPAQSVTPYIALLAILTVAFTAIKSKTQRRTKHS